jgi:hypothetical protein
MTTRYIIRKVSDPRSRGACFWFEAFAVSPAGAESFVGIFDTRQEAREAIRAIRAASRPEGHPAAEARHGAG